MTIDLSQSKDRPPRCPHDTIGICPQCFPLEARTLSARKLEMAIAWLQQIRAVADSSDPKFFAQATISQLAHDALNAVADMKR